MARIEKQSLIRCVWRSINLHQLGVRDTLIPLPVLDQADTRLKYDTGIGEYPPRLKCDTKCHVSEVTANV